MIIDDRQLAAVLASIGRDLDVGAPATATASTPGRRWRRALAVAAAVAALGVATVAAVAPARRAVSRWLDIGPTEMEVDVDVAAGLDKLPSFVEAGAPISPRQAEARLGRPLPDLASSPLGEPAAWLAPVEGGVVAVWDDESTSLWLLPLEGVGDEVFRKSVATADQVSAVADLGEQALLVDGDHLLTTALRRVRAATTLLWIDDGVVARLESARPAAELVDIAQQLAIAR